jgi:predicted nucleic acid-binding Zn ribbon protein
MSDDGPLQPKTRHCVVCALPIPHAAKVCTHCGSPQASWVRWAKRISVVAAGVVAMIPLFDAAKSLRSLAAGQHKADVTLRAVDCHPSGITIAAMNFGRGPAFIRSPVFRIEGESSGVAAGLQLRPEKGDITLLEPSGTVALTFTGWVRTASMDLPRRNGVQPCSYRIALTIEDTSGANQKEVQCNCPAD